MGLYHERQRLQLCLLHALNNLLQGKDNFSRKELDSIADSLAEPSDRSALESLLIKQHRNVITGNYDANVLMAALSSRGMEVRWHDRRKGSSELNLDLEDLAGIIVNLSSRRFLGLWKGRHWIALRVVDGVWYNLDSDLEAPVALEDEGELKRFLDDLLHKGAELFVVTNIPSSTM